jgi:LPS-assembly protein
MTFYRALLLTSALLGTPQLHSLSSSAVDLSQATTLRADQVTREEKFGLVIARGNVEIIHGQEELLAESVTYNEFLDTITASGNVRFKSKEGDVIFTQYLELSADFTQGASREIRMILDDGAKLAARRVTREGGVRASFDTAVYSPCEVCRQKPDKSPLWQIEARRTLIDDESQDVVYTDAVMRLWNVPVIYLPYFRHPSPKAKRRSGFLTPTFASASGSSGGFLAMPYFWAFADDKDLTVTPMYADSHPALGLGYRQRFSNGMLDITASGLFGANKNKNTASNQNNADKALERSFRGHVVGKMRFDLSSHWRVGLDLEHATDQTYFRRLPYFGYQKATALVSKAYAQHFNYLNYFSVEGYTFQGMRAGDRIATTPILLPVVEYSSLSRPGKWGETWSLDANALGLTRREGSDMQRLSLNGGVSVPYYSSWGDIYTLGGRLRGDLYNVRDYIRDTAQAPVSGGSARLFPQVYTHWRYPFVALGATHRVLVEPRVGLFVAPNMRQGKNIPNEDSRLIEFNTLNLFSDSRFAGLDRLDVGSRAVYGLGAQTSLADNKAGLEGFVGQSISLSEPQAFLRNTGLEYRWSHYVGRLEGHYEDWLNVGTRVLLNRVHLKPERQEFLAALGKPIFRVTADYLQLPAPQGETEALSKKKQITLGLSSQVTSQWSINTSTTRDVGSPSRALSHGAGFQYQDECFTFQLSAEKTFYKDRDVKPGVSVLFRIVFKNLGEIKHELNPKNGFSDKTT